MASTKVTDTEREKFKEIFEVVKSLFARLNQISDSKRVDWFLLNMIQRFSLR